MKKDRKPVYNKGGALRVISAPNGLWQLQEHDGKGVGHNRQPPTKTTTEKHHRDPWMKRGVPTDFDEAAKHLGPLQ